MTIDQVSSSLNKYIKLVETDYGKTQCKSIYEVIDNIFLKTIITSPQNLSNSVKVMQIFLRF